MSVAVGILKCIRNGYIDTVNCTFTQAVFDAVRNNQLDNKSFIYERDVNIAFSHMVRTRNTREHSDGINDKLQKMTLLPCTNKQCICYIVSLHLCFDIIDHVFHEDI